MRVRAHAIRTIIDWEKCAPQLNGFLSRGKPSLSIGSAVGWSFIIENGGTGSNNNRARKEISLELLGRACTALPSLSPSPGPRPGLPLLWNKY